MPDIRNEIIDNLQIRGSVSGGGVGSLARAIRIAMTSATSGSNGIQAADNANLDMATNDFTLHWEGSLPDYTPSVRQRLFYKILSDVGYSLAVEAGGLLRLYRNATTFDSTVATGLTDGSYAKFTVSVIRETATAAGSVTFYVNGVQLGTAVSITAAATVTLDNAGVFVFSGTDTVRIASDTTNAIIYNRALSAAEVLSLYNNGPALADLGASQTPVYTSDFSAGADSWTGTSLTVAGNVDGIGGRDNVLSITCTSTGASETPRATKTIFPVTDINKPGEIKLALYRPSSNTTITGLRVNNSSGNGVFTGTTTVDTLNTSAADTWEVFTMTGTMLGLTTDLRFSPVNSAGVRTQVTGEVIYVVDVTGKRLGITGWWDARDAQSDTGQILDSSGNKNHAMLPASGATVIGKPLSEARQVRGTNTWAASSSTQYVVGVNQNHLPTTAAWSTMDIIASGAVTVNIGDGSDVDRYGASIALSAGKNRVTLITPFNDGTNLKLTLTPTSSYTGTLETTATFIILED